MVQSKIIHVDVAFLTYNSKRCVDTPSVKQDSSCMTTLQQLHAHRDEKRSKKESMGPDAYNHYKWYNSMLCHELRGQCKNTTLKVIHWTIESGNTEAFMLAGVLFKAVSIIIGGSMEHWYCANIGKNASTSYGSRYRNNSRQHELNTKKIACFTIDDDEATLVVHPTSNAVSKCTPEVCVNNCIECKKFRSPFTNNISTSHCVCFPAKDEFKSIADSDTESDADSDDSDIAHIPSTFSGRRRTFNPRFRLNAIREE